MRHGALAAALVVLVLLAPAAPAQRAFPDTTNRVVVFNDQLATWGMTPAQVEFAATRYVGSQKLVRSDARRMRAVNPGFLVLHYRLGQALGHSVPSGCAPTASYIQVVHGDSWVQEWPGEAALQESWFFHHGASRVFSCSWGHYLMELDDPGWRAWWGAQVVQQLTDNEDDGLFADSFSVPNYFGGCDFSPCLPDVDPAFEAQWAAREHAFTDYVQGLFAGRWKWLPNVGALITSRDPSDLSNLDGGMVEGFAEWGGGGYFDAADWALQMNRILPLASAGKVLIAQTYPDPSDLAERLFVLGSYLLVKGSRTYLNLDTGLEPEWFPEYGVPLGAAVDPLPATIGSFFSAASQVYVRRFRNGRVLVNPGTATRTVDLGATLYRAVPAGGGLVPSDGSAPGTLTYTPVTQVTLGAHQAAILLDGPGTPPPGSFHTLPPCRVLDTRGPAGTHGGPALSCGGARRVFPVAGRCGVPGDASAVAYNLTVTGSATAGHLRLFATGEPTPPTSVLNYAAGQTRANSGVASVVGPIPGSVTLQCDSPSGTAHVLLDVAGYFR